MSSLVTLSISLAACAALVATAPFSFPLPDGFPSPSQQQLQSMEANAGGPISVGNSPAKIHPTTVTALQLVAFNELSEVAFYWEFLQNITDNVPGYAVPEASRPLIVSALTAIVSVSDICL